MLVYGFEASCTAGSNILKINGVGGGGDCSSYVTFSNSFPARQMLHSLLDRCLSPNGPLSAFQIACWIKSY